MSSLNLKNIVDDGIVVFASSVATRQSTQNSPSIFFLYHNLGSIIAILEKKNDTTDSLLQNDLMTTHQKTFTDRSFQLGSLTIPSRLIQGPLAGVSCAPFRVLAHQHGQPGYACTEMLSAAALASGGPQKLRFVTKNPEEGLLSVQLAARNAETIKRVADKLAPLQADLIDLNCGCPKQKIRKKGLGTRLLEDLDNLSEIVQTLGAHTPLPITVKIRLLPNASLQDQLDLCQRIASAGADGLIIHGRTWKDDYGQAIDLETITSIVETLEIPIIANGDVRDLETAQDLLSTGCAGIMIARASVGNPWLFAQLRAELDGKNYTQPTTQQRGDALLTHARGLMTLEPEKIAMFQMRKIGKYYACWAGIDLTRFLPKLYGILTYPALETLIQSWFIEDER